MQGQEQQYGGSNLGPHCLQHGSHQSDLGLPLEVRHLGEHGMQDRTGGLRAASAHLTAWSGRHAAGKSLHCSTHCTQHTPLLSCNRDWSSPMYAGLGEHERLNIWNCNETHPPFPPVVRLG